MSSLNRTLVLETLATTAGEPGGNLSLPMLFGLGAGLSFEYVHNPRETPSRFIIGFNRNIGKHLANRVGQYRRGNPRQEVIEALIENALLFNLDRSPTTALMGMEMLAEHLADFQGVPDWQSCLEGMKRGIVETGSFYRGVYVKFLRETAEELGTAKFWQSMTEIAREWDELAMQLDRASSDALLLEGAARALRRLAFREEHFWGLILEETKRMYPGER